MTGRTSDDLHTRSARLIEAFEARFGAKDAEIPRPDGLAAWRAYRWELRETAFALATRGWLPRLFHLSPAFWVALALLLSIVQAAGLGVLLATAL